MLVPWSWGKVLDPYTKGPGFDSRREDSFFHFFFIFFHFLFIYFIFLFALLHVKTLLKVLKLFTNIPGLPEVTNYFLEFIKCFQSFRILFHVFTNTPGLLQAIQSPLSFWIFFDVFTNTSGLPEGPTHVLKVLQAIQCPLSFRICVNVFTKTLKDFVKVLHIF